MHRRMRASMWRLLLPMPLAVGIVAMAGIAARRAWYASPSPSSRIEVRRDAATRVRPSGPLPNDAPSVSRPEVEAMPEAPAGLPQIESPAEPRKPVTPPHHEGMTPQASLPRPEAQHSSIAQSTRRGSALEPVAPSHEVALRASEPPPAVARAPRLAPAPVVPMVPSPEPKAAPKVSPLQAAEPLPLGPAQSVRAVRFDASYYYGRGLSARDLARELAASWAKQGVNLVYFYAYNRVYGARYRTSYAGNIMEDYGRQDLLRHLLREAHSRDIKVVAWLQGVQHKQAWEAHPGWREKAADGRDYKPDADSYFLCVRNPEVMQWWLGLLDDLLTSYPDLDGIDLAEFQLDLWGDNACHCERCRAQFAQAHDHAEVPGDAWRRFRAEGLTRVLLASSRLAHSYGKESHITTVLTARRDGKLMSTAQVRDAVGFDLEGVLNSPDRPDVLQAELIWQQWAALYSDRATFTPEWTKAAVNQAKQMLRGRARLIAHVEVTDFGSGGLDGPRLVRTIASAAQGGPAGIDIYDSYLLSQTEGAAGYLQTAWLNPGR